MFVDIVGATVCRSCAAWQSAPDFGSSLRSCKPSFGLMLSEATPLLKMRVLSAHFVQIWMPETSLKSPCCYSTRAHWERLLPMLSVWYRNHRLQIARFILRANGSAALGRHLRVLEGCVGSRCSSFMVSRCGRSREGLTSCSQRRATAAILSA